MSLGAARRQSEQSGQSDECSAQQVSRTNTPDNAYGAGAFETLTDGYRASMWLFLLIACAGPEPLNLPEDPAVAGVPVGVRTLNRRGLTIEIWYPASDKLTDEPGEALDLTHHVPQVFSDHVDPFDLPPVQTRAIRDAELRVPETPYPVILFSHGFTGFREQSVDYTTHLASRGYVVASADHWGRHLADALPCLFLPALDGCNLALGGGEQDPAATDLPLLADWIEEAATNDSFLSGAIDPSRMGLTGHSAGGASTGGVGSEDVRFKALLPMAGSAPVTRDVPTRVLAGTCDSTFPLDDILANQAASVADVELVRIVDAGHMAFSDICPLDLPSFARDVVEPLPDANTTLLPLLLQLASDGCPYPDNPPAPDQLECTATEYLPLEQGFVLINGSATEFFDTEL